MTLPRAAVATLFAIASLARAAEPTPVTITVDPTPRQTFAGLGAGAGNWSLDYQKLNAEERATLARLV